VIYSNNKKRTIEQTNNTFVLNQRSASR